MIAMLGPSSPDRIGKNSRPARASRWLGRVLCGAAVLAAAALAAPPVYAQAAPAVRAVEPAAVREQIESLLGRMAAAVRAADQEAYLACVSLDDPVFATEQRNWAKDLERAAPERFELTLRDDPVVGPDGAAEVTLRTSWRMAEGRDRSVSFPVRFVPTDNGWLYAGERWKTVVGDRVVVMYEGDLEDVAKEAASLLPEVRARVEKDMGLENDLDLTGRIQQVKLYTSMRHLQHSIYLSYASSLSGWNEPGESIKILASDGMGRSAMRTLLAHEYGHVATFQLGPAADDAPWWVLEGIAELVAERYAGGRALAERMVRRWAVRDRLVPWEKLADFHGEAARHTMQVYTQGHHMLGYISDRFGRDRRNRWLRELANGATLDDASRTALELSFEDLDRDWRAALTDQGEKRQDQDP